MRRRTMPGRRAAVAVATALSFVAASAVSAAPALAGQQAGLPSTASTMTADRTTDDPAGSSAAGKKKLTETLRARLGTGKSGDFWIRFEQTADLERATTIADWGERGRYVYDELTAAAKESQADVVAELRAAGADHESYWINNSILVTDGDLELATRLAAEPEVTRVHERVAVEPIEPVEQRPAGDVEVAAVEWGVEAVNAPAAWDLGHTGEGITVATVDSGADLEHPALATHYRGVADDGSVEHDYNWFDASGGCGGEPCDRAGHGTHVMGTMVGDDGGENQIGVAPGAEWIAANGCDSCSDADLLASGQWILAPTRADGSQPNPALRPHVVNNSWGSQLPGDINDFFADEVAAWEAAGIFGVWAAGNAGEAGCQSTSSPGANAATYSVGATTSEGEIAAFSSRGPGEDGVIQPNIAAPGEEVRSSVPGGDYEVASGTSMAAPHVTGAVAVLWSAVPSLVGDIPATQDLLNTSAVDHADDECGGTPENNNVYGEGDLDVLALVEAAGEEERGYIAGSVTDADGEPVDGATVTVGERSTGTDASGAFRILLPAGTYDVRVEAFGFVAGIVEGVEVSDGGTAAADFVLERAPMTTVTGTVTDGSGHGWPLGAKVRIAEGPASYSTWTDPFTGEYTLEVPANATHTVVAEPMTEGYATSREAVEVPAEPVVHDVAAQVTAACVAPGYEFGGAGIPVEEFESGEVPEGWSVEDLAGTGEVWTFDDAFGYGNMTGGEGLFAEVNSDAYGPEGHQDTTLTTAPLDFSGLSAPALTFDQAFDTLGEYADVDLSVDGGETWETVLHQTAPAQGPMRVDLSAAGGEDDALVRFHLGDAFFGFWWQIDNVGFGECLPVEGGLVSGHVTDLNTGDGVVGATVSDTEFPDDGVRTTDPANTHVRPGYYSLFVPAGERTVSVVGKGYVTDESGVRVSADAITRHDVVLAAPRLAVTPDRVSAETVLGGSRSGRFTVTNEGTAPAEVEVYPGSSDFEILSTGTPGGVIKGVEREATEVATAPAPSSDTRTADRTATAGTARPDPASERYAPHGRPGKAVTPAPTPSLLVDEGTTITHSSSQEIVPGNSVACVGAATQVLRTFTLEDFGIGGEFAVTNVSFGVEAADPGTEVTVNLYTLDGDLLYENMEPLGSATTTLENADLTLVDVPVEGTAPAGSTLVVEVASPDGSFFFVGSNAEPETAPTYLASEPCGNPEPAEVADLGFPDMHAVINVTGETSVDVPWLDVQPPVFSLEPGESATVHVAMDSSRVDQPGTYESAVVVNGSTPYRAPRATVSMSVKPPKNWGKIAGTVTGQPCEGDPAPLEGAFVKLDGSEYDVTLVTGPDGGYARWMGVSNNKLTLLSSADGYPPEMKSNVRIIKGRTVVHDFTLTEYCG
ncbi:S8 family serine peptidase [Myceligenerans pegani]|uniref:S8 family serine peptidase n=1 Tax=Myceligenerans pegani TaxID=2776917 RepID=A0ABR9N4L8_9MICO|nr:S8 family serine peptidase [Myceligenerans sp. TRM 65318]MBE1877927.1 S8 family serine peptidase [Myceligenerans sp. TRM 65318]MBE3020198.1 S8 family serine peptidase [Myceligenerans sp. TRM 65318]